MKRRSSRWRRRRSSTAPAPSTTRAGSSRPRRPPRAARHRSRRRRGGARRARPRVVAAAGIDVVVYDRAHVEPTLESLQEAAAFAADAGVDGFVSVGGGSSIDTAKVADLVVSHPAPVMAYVNAPVGERAPPARAAAPAPRDPDDDRQRLGGDDRRRCSTSPTCAVKTGHLAPRPAAGAGDRRPRADRAPPPAEVVASTGLDVVCHAAESFLARPYTSRERPASPDDRPPYQGANPGGRRVVGEGARVRRPLPARARGGRRRRRAAR